MADPVKMANILQLELRQQTLEKEVSLLKDTIWKLTGRIYVLETFLGDKFGILLSNIISVQSKIG